MLVDTRPKTIEATRLCGIGTKNHHMTKNDLRCQVLIVTVLLKKATLDSSSIDSSVVLSLYQVQSYRTNHIMMGVTQD